MKKHLIYNAIVALPTLFLSACGSVALGVQLPGNDGSSGDVNSNTLLYILVGAAVLIGVVALVGRKSS